MNEVDQTEELIPTPVASIEDLPSFVTKLLDSYDRLHRLTWFNDSIPEDEVWVKIGGDHGGGSFKVMLQVANLQQANSKHNTNVITLVECKDTPENLRRILGPYKDQLAHLQTMQWRGKRLRLFFFGDYEFLTKVYGLSGAQAIHPCLYCTAARAQIHAPPSHNEGNVSKRTLTQIKRDYQRHSRSGKKKSTAKLFNNVIRKPLVELELEQVAPPYLHILLGIVKKHHVMLEDECHALDVRLAKSLAREGGQFHEGLSQTFKEFVQRFEAVERTKRQIRTLQARPIPPGQERSRQEWIKQRKQELQTIISEVDPLRARSGPITAHLDVVLKENHIFPQTYHGKALIGNHCNKYLKPAAYQSICHSVVQKTEELTDDREIIIKAQDISRKFEQLNSLYSKVHQNVSHQQPVPEESIPMIEQSIMHYMAFFRATFPQIRIIPKQHLLEQHCVSFIRQWGVGLALLGEQGGEGVHATMNILTRRAWAQKHPINRLKVLLGSHLTLVSPQLQGVFHFRKKLV